MSAPRRVRFLMTCVGGILAPALIQLLKASPNFRYEIIGCDSGSDRPLAASIVDSYHVVPSGGSSDYVEELLRIAQEQRVDVVWPASDTEASQVSAAAQRFDALGIKLLCGSAGTIAIIRDKALVYSKLAAAGVVVPEYSLCETADDIRAAIRSYQWPNKTVIMKPATGRGGRGLHVFCGADAPSPWLGVGQREGRHSADGISLELIESYMEGPTLVMPALTVPAFDVDVLGGKGQALAVIVRERSNPTGIPFSGNRICVDREVEDYCRSIAECLGLDSLYDIDLLSDSQGRGVRLLEVNPRPSGSLAASLAAGYPLIDAAVGCLIGENIVVPQARESAVVLPIPELIVLPQAAWGGSRWD